jgi:chromate transporter
VIATRSIIDIPTALIAISTVFVLIYGKKVRETHIIFISAMLGLLIKSVL